MASRSTSVQIASHHTKKLAKAAQTDNSDQASAISIQIPVRVIGIGLAGLLVLGFLALSSWSVDDPSFSLATDKSPDNMLGFFGAALADLLLQFFGLAAIGLLLVPSFWAYRLIRRERVGHWITRIIFWLATSITIAASLSFVAQPETWPLPTGLGGLVGNLFNSLAASITQTPPEGLTSALFALLFVPPAAGLFWLATRKFKAPELTESEQEAENDEPQNGFFDVLFGGTMHIAMSARSAWQRTRAKMAERRAQEEAAYAMPTGAQPQTETGTESVTPFTAQQAQVEPEAIEDFTQNAERAEPRFDSDFTETNQAWDEDLYPEDDSIVVEPDLADHHAPVPSNSRPSNSSGFDDDAARRSVESNSTPTSQRVAAPQATVKPGTRVLREAQGSLLSTDGFELPELALLTDPPQTAVAQEHLPQNLEANARKLESVLADFGVKGDIINVRPGPVVTLYELEPAPGIKSSRVISLADDIARSMSAVSARVAVVAGRNAIGIELPNKSRETVYLREMLASSDFEKMKGKLPMCLGKTIGGEPIIADLARMPHLLIAGTTGSGKSVAVNTMILSLLYRMTPEQCRLIMIDPKMLELSIYDGIPHLLSPVVTDPSKAVTALKWAVREMEDRYRKMSKIGVRNIDGFNKRVAEAKRKGETITRTVQTGFDRETGEAIYESEDFDLEPLPFIVVIVDEMADLMMVAGKDIEGAIQRLAQMARAAGIHLIMATQRPSVDVITGTIKANFPTRISFQVTSKIDSRTILGEQGAEQLLGMGDMLYMAGGGRTKRLHGPFVDDNEVEAVVQHLKDQGTPDYLESVTEDQEEGASGAVDPASGQFGGSGDELYDKAVNIVLNDRKASTSYIQRRLSIGYNRAATLIERMEEEGVISPANHAGKREVLVGDGVDHG